MPVPATKGQLRTRIEDMQIGDYIVCNYLASSGAVGIFSNLGGTAGTEIPVTGSATPNGTFYFVKVDKGLLIADRVVQHSIRWDTLNAGKVIQGRPADFIRPSGVKTVTASGNTPGPNNYGSPWNVFNGLTKASGVDNYMSSWVYNTSSPNQYLTIELDYAMDLRIITITGGALVISGTDHSGIRNFSIQGSNDGVTFSNLFSGVHPNDILKPIDYVINNTTSYKFYRIIIADSYVANWYGIGELSLMDSQGNKIQHSFIVRSLTGGVAYADANGNSSTTDQGTGKAFPSNSEFDKYIVEFDLTEIQDEKTLFDVFHHDVVKTWTQDTPIISIAAATNRVTRGGTTGTNNFSYLTSTTTDTTVGFRPVLEFMEE